MCILTFNIPFRITIDATQDPRNNIAQKFFDTEATESNRQPAPQNNEAENKRIDNYNLITRETRRKHVIDRHY